jgi:hypothetical protein
LKPCDKKEQTSMEATALAASKRALDALRAIPFYVIAAILLSAALIWTVPPFLAVIPEAARPWVPLALAIAAIVAACHLANSIASSFFKRRRVITERDRLRLVHLYRPLTTLFLTRHVTTSTFVKAPRLTHRLENAWSELGRYRRRMVGVKRAARALFDRLSSTSGEIEFGGGFPLAEIIKLVRRHAEHADAELLNLIARADRSRYEEPGGDLLTDAELALFEYIERRHERLSRRFD